jgi:hypothetical protein
MSDVMRQLLIAVMIVLVASPSVAQETDFQRSTRRMVFQLLQQKQLEEDRERQRIMQTPYPSVVGVISLPARSALGLAGDFDGRLRD